MNIGSINNNFRSQSVFHKDKYIEGTKNSENTCGNASPLFQQLGGRSRSSSCNQPYDPKVEKKSSGMENNKISKTKRGSLWNLFRGKKSNTGSNKQWDYPNPVSDDNNPPEKELCKAVSTPNVFPQVVAIDHIDQNAADDTLSKTSDLGDSTPSTPVSTISSAGQVETPGIVGLHNLGNTCYFNSILQCLAHVDVFSEYFAMDNFIKDISSATLPAVKKYKNKSSTYNNNKGELTYMLAVMIKSLWHSDLYSIDVARELHEVIGYYERQYSGAEEQDAQEFLMWLINKIHEESVKAPRKKQKDLLKVILYS